MPLFAKEKHGDGGFVRRILVATDRSQTADHAVAWAAEMARRYEAELVVLQVAIGGAAASIEDLQQYAAEVAGERGIARIASGEEPAQVICEVGEDEDVDVIVVGNVGMSGRKEFLLGNVPNRVSHNTRRTVIIVNTAAALEEPKKKRFWQ
jgi:nucleotide-binding universal stress UspA family protein